MKTSNMTRPKGQVYCVGNYLMTGRVLGKGHFARVEEATHRIIGKKVAIKIIDLTCIKEEYARRNLHREPRVMAKLRHPCIAALYETMMHGPRLYVVMEAAGGGDLCAHVLCARGAARGLPEARARHLAAQLVSAVRHMHARGVVHRDLKMENIMLDTTKQFIKIVDFGLSNIWTAGGALRTPCGSLEYAAPELFVDGRRYGPEVDLWSIGVIVYGMVTGGLPFTGAEGGEGGEGRSRPQLRAAIARGFTRKQRAALACVSNECKMFVQQLLEPNVESRMKIDEAARHRWIKKPGMKMKTHPLMSLEPKAVKEIHRQISELCGQTPIDVMAQIRADPFGAVAGMYNIKTHLHQMHAVLGTDLLWTSALQEPRPLSPPEYKAKYDVQRLHTAPSSSKYTPPTSSSKNETPKPLTSKHQMYNGNQRETITNAVKPNGSTRSLVFSVPKCCSVPGSSMSKDSTHISTKTQTTQPITNGRLQTHLNTNGRILSQSRVTEQPQLAYEPRITQSLQSPAGLSLSQRSYLKKPTFRAYDNGDCGLDPRLPSIDEHSSTEIAEAKRNIRYRSIRAPSMRKTCLDDDSIRLNSCPTKISDGKRSEFYRRAGDGLPCWRSNSVLTTTPPTKILLQNNATTIKRASLGNIVSPHSSSNSHCKSERAMPVGWFSSRSRESAPLQRFRRTAPMK